MSLHVTFKSRELPPWFDQQRLSDVFAFPWPPWEARACIVSEDASYVTIESRYSGNTGQTPVIQSVRTILQDMDQIVVLHEALFLSEESGAQSSGYATEMLRRCLPFYRSVGARLVIIPAAVMAGRTAWPKFGFRIADEVADGFRAHLRALHEQKLGLAFQGEVPLEGEALIALQGAYDSPIGRMALRTFDALTLELDLESPTALESLKRRGIVVA